MKTKTTLLLVVLGVLAVGAVLLFSRRTAHDERGWSIGDAVFRSFPVNDIATIVVRANGQTVTVTKAGGVWVVKEYYNYPARFDAVADLLKTIYNMRVGQLVRVRPASLGQLQLRSVDQRDAAPQECGTQLEFIDGTGALVAQTLVGAAKQGEPDERQPYRFAMTEGTYILPPSALPRSSTDRINVVIVKDALQFGRTPDAWIDKQLLNAASETLSKITVTEPDGASYTLSRTNAAAEFVLAGLAATQQLKSAEVASLGNALSYLNADDVLSPDDTATNTALTRAWVFSARSFDGTVYTLRVADTNSAKACAALSVAYTQPPKVSVASNIAEHIQTSTADAEETARKLQARLAPWQFVLPEFKANTLRTPRANLIENKPEKLPPTDAPTPDLETKTPPELHDTPTAALADDDSKIGETTPPESHNTPAAAPADDDNKIGETTPPESHNTPAAAPADDDNKIGETTPPELHDTPAAAPADDDSETAAEPAPKPATETNAAPDKE